MTKITGALHMIGTHRFALRALSFAIATAGLSVNAHASMGNLATSYGLLPMDIASAQGLSMFNEQASATYYNPSFLTSDERGEMTAGILHSEQELRASRSDATGDVLADSPSQHVLLGFKTNLSSLTRAERPIYLGLMLGVEKYGKEMLAFRSETSDQGQFLQFGKEPLFLNVGGATEVIDGLAVGASARVTLEASANLQAVSTLGGETSKEKLSVNAEPSLKAILGTTITPSKLFCNDDCILDGWELALAYRTKSAASTAVDANVIVNQTIPDPGLTIAVATIDSFQPETFSMGLQYKGDGWRIAGSLEQQRWSELEDEFKGDSIKDQAELSPSQRIKFDDILIPRIGLEYQLSRNFIVTSGVAYEESPLSTDRNPDLNYFDTDRAVFGLGLTAIYERTRILAFPVRLDLGYQYQRLLERDFTLVSEDSAGNTTDVPVTADGDIHVVSASLTLKF
ncbi:outer membrane protein transport protein [Marinobacter sp. NSM]|uniref:outer membrane protein transport protein n=1 Tax=Marinobacter sp. NSM TaxID=3458004 RepID=UPI0040359C74